MRAVRAERVLGSSLQRVIFDDLLYSTLVIQFKTGSIALLQIPVPS
jgi:hypothetical protein